MCRSRREVGGGEVGGRGVASSGGPFLSIFSLGRACFPDRLSLLGVYYSYFIARSLGLGPVANASETGPSLTRLDASFLLSLARRRDVSLKVIRFVKPKKEKEHRKAYRLEGLHDMARRRRTEHSLRTQEGAEEGEAGLPTIPTIPRLLRFRRRPSVARA